MEIPEWMFSSFWAVIGGWSLILGIDALDKTDLPTSVSPVVLSFFRASLLITNYFPSTYSLSIRLDVLAPIKLCTSVIRYILSHSDLFAILASIELAALFLSWMYMIISGSKLSGWRETMIFIFLAIQQHRVIYSTDLVYHSGQRIHICTLYLQSRIYQRGRGASTGMVGRHRHCRANQVPSKLKMIMRGLRWLSGTPISMLSPILFQYFFELNSFDHVVVFLYLALAWLSNLALLLCHDDFWIFNFLLNNAILGAILNISGTRGKTWLAFGACVLLHLIRRMLQGLSRQKREEKNVIVWRNPIHQPTHGTI